MLLLLLTVATSVVQAATSSFHHDLSPPLHEFTAPRAFLAQRFAERRAHDKGTQLRIDEASSKTGSDKSNPQQWNVRGGGGIKDEKDAPPGLGTATSASGLQVPSLSHSVRTRRKTWAQVSVLFLAESVLFVGSHLEPLGRRLGTSVNNQSWRPALHELSQHSRFLAGIFLGFVLVR